MPTTELYITLAIVLIGFVLSIMRVIAWVLGRDFRPGQWIMRRVFGRKPDATVGIEQTGMARLGVGNLPGDVGLIAGFGKTADAPQTLNDRILRPTLGLRLLSLGFSAALFWYLFLGPAEMRLPNPMLSFGLAAVVIYGVIAIQTYEIRYDDYRIVLRGWRFQRDEVLWRDVASLKDNGHYLYVLRTHMGRKYEIQKYVVGISGFVAYAQDQISKNHAE